MKDRILLCAVIAITAAALPGAVLAFAFEDAAPVRLPRSGLALAQAQNQPNGLFQGVGVVTDVSPETGSLTINHEEIPGFMPPMEMLFRVDPRSASDGVRAGDKIEFSVEGKTYTIRAIKVIERAKK